MFIYLNTETTGTNSDDRLCQLAFKTGQGTIVNELFNPGRPIAIEAMAVHYITNEMVKTMIYYPPVTDPVKMMAIFFSSMLQSSKISKFACFRGNLHKYAH